MSRFLRPAQLPVILTILLVVLLVVLTGRSGVIVRVYLLALAAIALFHLVRLVSAAHPAGPSRFDAALRRRPQPQERLAELAKVEREVALGMATAFDLHYRLRPALRRTASELLASRRGIDLDRQPEAARRALGDDAWEIVRGDREPPDDRFGPGVELAALRRTVSALESL